MTPVFKSKCVNVHLIESNWKRYYNCCFIKIWNLSFSRHHTIENECAAIVVLCNISDLFKIFVGFFWFGNGSVARILLSQNNTNQQWQLHSSEGHTHVLHALIVISNTSLALMFIYVEHKNSVPNIIKHYVTIRSDT